MANNRDGLVQHMRQWLGRQGIDANATLIAGVSGGLDSMVLAETLTAWASTSRRTRELPPARRSSDADQALVEEWCAARASLSRAQRPSEIRPSTACKRKPGNPLCPLRTVARRSQRPPGPPGLHRHGPPRRRPSRNRAAPPHAVCRSARPRRHARCGCERGLLRPFLTLTRAELAEACSAWNVAYREDASNAKPDYLRNRIRHEVLPLFDSLRPGTTAHVAHWADRFQSLRSFFTTERDAATHAAGK